MQIFCAIAGSFSTLIPKGHPAYQALMMNFRAISVGKRIVRYLLDVGVSQEAILTSISGNGAYVLVRLPDYEITSERTELKKRLLHFFADQFSTDRIEIDRKVFNPARLIAALGTLKMKGESIAERPHRRSEIRTIAGVKFDPSLNQRCEPFNLYSLAEVLLSPEPKRKPASKANSNSQSFDVEQWMEKHGLDVANIKQWAGTDFGGRLYVLRVCPFNPDHYNKSAFIIQADNGALSFGCHHNSCANYRWHDLRALYEPDLVSVGTESNAGKESTGFSDSNTNDADESLNVAAWPTPLAPEAFHGPIGELVYLIEPHTEADPVALLIQALVAFGSVIGRTAHFVAEADKHFMNLFAVLVGATSKGRKGTSWGRIRFLFETLVPEWSLRVQSGLSSGEGLIWAVRDQIEKNEPIREKKKITGYQKVIVDEGVEDKRLFVVEAEFASTLRVLGREGNTLSALLRQAWDKGDLRVLTKNSPAQATGAHISLIGHITSNELRRYLDTTEAGNGFANRILWPCVRRSKSLPEGGNFESINFAPVIGHLREAIAVARVTGKIMRDEKARSLWIDVYDELSEGKPGLLGAITSRAEAQVMRLACLYALLDCEKVIRKHHLEAALALWRYCEDSARFIFGDSLGDPVADEILRALRKTPDGMTRTEIRDLFGRHRGAREIGRALTTLSEQGLAYCKQEQTDGRPVERWFATKIPATKAIKATKASAEGTEADPSVASVAFVATSETKEVASNREVFEL